MENKVIRPPEIDLRAPTWLLKDAAALPRCSDSPSVLGFLQAKKTDDLYQSLLYFTSVPGEGY